MHYVHCTDKDANQLNYTLICVAYNCETARYMYVLEHGHWACKSSVPMSVE
jgi:hypothetical protein